MKKAISFRLTPEALRLIREAAEALGISQSAIIEIAIRNYTDRQRNNTKKEKNDE